MITAINRQELLDLKNSKDKSVVIADVLPEDHFKQIHIKGAISLPAGKIVKYALRRLNKNDHIIVYCANRECQASSKAADMLQLMGFNNIYTYEDGLADYEQAGLPLEGLIAREEPRSSCS